MLEKPVKGVLSYLVLQHLAGRKYFKEPAAVNGQQQQPEVATVNGESDGPENKKEKAQSLENVDELDRIELEKIVNR